MKKIAASFLFVLGVTFVARAQVVSGEDIAVTNTYCGKVRGYISNDIYVYKGIPYAEADRFEAPHKPKSWTGIRNSLNWGPVAPLETPITSLANEEAEFLYEHDFGYASEDCMRLNIWTPAINDGKKRPVMFWLHGGGYTVGSSQELPSYDGENIAKKGDVVLVTINHRLNILGFLDLSAYGEKYKYSANLSILDIRFALEWVKNNIANFGGDPDNVTIFGQSGGGGKVNTLMAMPSAKRLFEKAINESGAFGSTLNDKSVTQAVGDQVLQILDIHPKNVDEIQKISFLELVDAGRKALRIVGEKIRTQGGIGGRGLGWGPSVDGDLIPYQINSDQALALSKDVPLMIGTVKNEFVTSLTVGLSNGTEQQVKEYIDKQWKDKAEAFIRAVKKAYPNDTKPSDLIDVDTRFRPGAIKQANQKSALSGGAPVYMYLFTWQSPSLGGKYKAWHCMELPFVFVNIDKCTHMTGGGPETYKLAEKMSQSWINFARTGNPNAKGLPKWETYTEATGTTMIFDNKCEVKYKHDKELMDLVQQ
ncbi:MAG: carboxylesterase/lipase family protein [Bacteroidia bacterium]|nr:carboxylesterase/lipase family protein [Bacteroidia bacterium]